MPTVYTLGYQQRPLRDFIETLRDAGVDAVIDIRLRNTSHLAGYTKKDTLAYLLQEGFDIAYEHRPELAPTDEILDAYEPKNPDSWARYERAFIPLLREREAERLSSTLFARYRAPCLLCREASADRCHRRLVAEYWAEHTPDLRIVHL